MVLVHLTSVFFDILYIYDLNWGCSITAQINIPHHSFCNFSCSFGVYYRYLHVGLSFHMPTWKLKLLDAYEILLEDVSIPQAKGLMSFHQKPCKNKGPRKLFSTYVIWSMSPPTLVGRHIVFALSVYPYVCHQVCQCNSSQTTVCNLLEDFQPKCILQ